MAPIRIIIADDSQAIRVSIRRLLSKMPNVEFVGEAANGLEAVSMVKNHQPDILLLDIEMPVMDGLEAIRQLHKDRCEVKVIILSAYDDGYLIRMVMEGGASGYLVKNDAPRQLKEAIFSVVKGNHNWLSKEASARAMF